MRPTTSASSFSWATLIRQAPAHLLAELRSWPAWWSALSLRRKISPVLFVALYWSTLAALKGFRSDHLHMGLLILILTLGGGALSQLFRFLFPLIATGIVYDSQRFYSDYLRGTVRVAEPYLFDKTFFGIRTAGGILTPNEWWQLHTHPALDLITGFFYLAFIGIFVLICAHFFFRSTRTGTARYTAEQMKPLGLRPMWSFLWVNLIGYTTYYWYPAAPPWYVALHGLGPAKMDTPANPAGCIRFDELLGTHFFTGMYGRSADVFGAIPSLHVAYPLIALIYAFRFKSLRAFSVFFYAIMCFSAVYLNHHYVLDILWGSAYSVLTVIGVEWVCNRKLKRAQV